MVREIINIQIGRCGNRISGRFFDKIAHEHLISPSDGLYYGDSDDYLYGIKTYFNENIGNKYTPRSILIGYDPSNLDKVLTGESPQTYYYYYQDYDRKFTFNDNWAYAYYINYPENEEHMIDTIRKEAEKCEFLQGFQFVHSSSGGMSSGICSHLIEALHDEYPEQIILTNSILPSTKFNDNILEPYNFVLSIGFLKKFASEVICIDNEAVFDICCHYLRSETVSYGDVNYIISQMMSNFTCPFRFKDQFNSDLNKTVVNLNPFPRLHFIISNLPSITSRGSTNRSFSTDFLASNLFKNEYMFADCNLKNGTFLAGLAQFRGISSLKEIYDEIDKNEKPEIPNFKLSTCKYSCFLLSQTASLFCNTTAVNDVFNRIYDQFKQLYEKKYFFHVYLNEGLEPDEFDESSNMMKNLIDEYNMIE